MRSRMRPATLAARAVAAALDVAVLVAVVAAVAGIGLTAPGGVVSAAVAGLVAAVAVTAAQWRTRARRGWTVGQLVLGLRTVDAVTARPVGLRRLLHRTLVVAAGGLVTGVGAVVVLVSPAFDRSGRRVGWHDEVAGVEVLRVRHRAPDLPVVVVRPVPSAEPAAEPEPDAPLPVGSGSSWEPVVSASPVLAFGLMPELERTRPAGARGDVAWDDGTSYVPLRAALALSDGTVHDVQGTVLVGRNPIAAPGETGLRLVDSKRSMSRTHLRFVIGPDVVWVEDLGSTNGTTLHLPDGSTERCEPSRAVVLPVGSVASAGDCWVRLESLNDGEQTFPDQTTQR